MIFFVCYFTFFNAPGQWILVWMAKMDFLKIVYTSTKSPPHPQFWYVSPTGYLLPYLFLFSTTTYHILTIETPPFKTQSKCHLLWSFLQEARVYSLFFDSVYFSRQLIGYFFWTWCEWHQVFLCVMAVLYLFIPFF